jgi:hypothetical protein
VRERHLLELPPQPTRLLVQPAEVLVLHLVLAIHLLHHQFTVAVDVQLLHAEFVRQRKPLHQRRVLRDVVRCGADGVGLLDDGQARTRKYDRVRRLSGVAA